MGSIYGFDLSSWSSANLESQLYIYSTEITYIIKQNDENGEHKSFRRLHEIFQVYYLLMCDFSLIRDLHFKHSQQTQAEENWYIMQTATFFLIENSYNLKFFQRNIQKKNIGQLRLLKNNSLESALTILNHFKQIKLIRRGIALNCNMKNIMNFIFIVLLQKHTK